MLDRWKRFLPALGVGFTALGSACQSNPAPTPPVAPAPQYLPPAGPRAQAPPPQYLPPSAPPVQAPPPRRAPPAVARALPPRPVGTDPLDTNNRAWQRQRAQAILLELVSNLPAASRARVRGIPLLFDGEAGMVNAFASCSAGRASMAISDGLLEVVVSLARAQAHDDTHRTNKTGDYIRFASLAIRHGHLSTPPTGLVPTGAVGGPRQLARQHELFEEQLAFVLGHELGHHYLGHLPCTGSPGLWGSAEVARVFAAPFPAFDQASEHQADVAGTHNVLTAGRARTGSHWTEKGALLTMRFFSSLSGGQILDFQRSHPHPQVRIPVIQGTARIWQTTGGLSLPTLL